MIGKETHDLEMYMQADAMWKDFVSLYGIEASSYELCQFGMTREEVNSLAQLAREGVKQATAGLLESYKREGEPLPKPGDFHVVTDWEGNAVCIIQASAVEVLPFDQITHSHAAKEGEGDKSLAYWRQAHLQYFTWEASELGLVFHESMEVVFMHFKTVYPQGGDVA
ncbi:MAG: ASCH domain-containing protein [Spirochaetota bacterium]